MALVQAKNALRSGGLLQKVSRFVTPPNPSGPSSFLWKSDSFSLQKRALVMARMRSFKMTFFSSTQVVTPQAEIHTTSVVLEAEAAQEDVKGNVTSAGTSSSETDPGLLDRNYGDEQADHHKVAESTHEHHVKTQEEEEPESLETTGFDMSKMSRPSGDE
ncbi:unnamed protein product [Calypogeia fissa]